MPDPHPARPAQRRKNAIAGPHGDALKVRIAAPAADNKANEALVDFLSGTLGVPKSYIAIRHGARARQKVIEIAAGPELAARAAKLC